MLSTKTWFYTTALLGLVAMSSFAAAPYQFTIDSALSGFLGKAGFAAATSGTLIGDYDVASNPTGTRTKPGLFGSFGATENLPVMVSLSPMLGGDIDSSNVGSFELAFDELAGSVTLANYAVDFLADGPATLPIGLTLSYETFRTRSPESLYPGGIPITIPLGSAELSSLTATQSIAASVGTLTPSGPGVFDFSVATLVQLNGAFMSPLGSTSIPSIPLPFVLQGQVAFSGLNATVHSVSMVSLAPVATPNLVLPQFPLGLPTILPPGGTANLLFDLSLSQISGAVSGTQTLVANGHLVPEPTVALCLLLPLLLYRRPRPTR